jgi:hypothetical protein
MDRRLVPGDQRRREDDGLTRADLDPLVLSLRHQREGRVRLPLRAGADHDDAPGIEPLDLRDVHDVLVVDVQMTESPSGIDGLEHRTSEERDDALIRTSGVHDLLHAMDVAREARCHHQAPGVLDDVEEDRPHRALADRVPRFLGVRRVGEEQMDALAATGLLGQTVEVRCPPVERRLVDLEVACVQDRSERRVDHDRHPVRDRVRDAKEPHRERARRGLLPRGDGPEVDEVLHLVLFELALQQGERERRAVDLETTIDVAEQVRERTDVILVPVGEDHRLDPIGLRS